MSARTLPSESLARMGLRMTADEYRAMPEGGPRYELIDGVLHPMDGGQRMSPAPSSRHQLVSGRIFRRVDEVFGPPAY